MLGIWQGDRQYLSPVTIGNVDISGKSFVSEESKVIPGFALTYTSGPSLFAMGNKYDPFDREIVNARFGGNYPFESKFKVPGDMMPGSPGFGYTSQQAAEELGYSHGAGIMDMDKFHVGKENHFTLAFNLISTHFDPKGYRFKRGGGMETAATSTTGMDDYNGTLPVLGWDSNHRYATSVHEIDFAQTLNPNSKNWNFGKYYSNKANDIHGGHGNLPTFNGFLTNQGYNGRDIQLSDSLAFEKGKEFWMKHTKFILLNADHYNANTDIGNIVTEGINQLLEGFDAVTLKNKKIAALNAGTKMSGIDITGASTQDFDKYIPNLNQD